MTPVAYKVNTIEGIPVMTLLVESINVRNAHWIKDEILQYLTHNQPKGLLLNLNNVVHIGHIGLGALIAVNNQIRHLTPHALIGVQPEIMQKIQASQLDQLWRIWAPGQPCPICNEEACRHLPILEARCQEFLAKDHPVDESQIPHLGEASVYQVPPRLDLGDAHPIPPRGGKKIGTAVAAVLILAFVIGGTWLTATKYLNRPEIGGKPLSRELMLAKYDRNRDGKLDAADLAMMSDSERFLMSFPPFCHILQTQCSNGESHP